jgi:CHAT domain-containing protein
VAYWHLGRIREAEQYYMKALEKLGDAADHQSLERKVSANGNLGVMWQSAGDFARAKTYYHESLRNSDRVIAAAKDPFLRDDALVNRSRTYVNLATVHQQMGDIGRARELLAIAWKDRSAVLEPDDPQLLTVKDRLADIEMEGGSLDSAEVLVSSYAAACERKFGSRSEEYIRACSKLGEIARRKGHIARADSLFALSIAAGKLNADEATDVVLVQTLQHRARMNMEAGRTKAAIADLQRARQVLVNIYDTAHYKVAGMDVLLAEAAFRGGDPAGAQRYSRSAMTLMKDRITALRGSHAPLTFPDPHIFPDAVQWSVRAQRALAKPGAVRPEWNTDLDLAVTALARNKSALDDEASKLLLIGAQKSLFDLAMDIAYETHAASKSDKDLERFLSLTEADRSILLKGRLNAFAGLRFAGVPDSITAREHELVTALAIDPSDHAAASQMDRREQAYTAFLARLEKEYPMYFQLRYGEPGVTLDQVRKRLLTPERNLLVFAFVGDHLHALVVRTDTAALLRLDASGVAVAVAKVNESVAARSDAYVTEAHTLYQKILDPVRGLLRGDELLIVPDGPLHTLNFELLLTKASTPKNFREHLLLQEFAIADLLSVTTAVQFADLARRGKEGVLALAPGFDDQLKQNYLTKVNDSALIDHRYLRYVRQPFAVNTAQELGGTMDARVLLGSDATEKNFRSSANEYGILHLGTHAEMNATTPMYSRLVLSKDGSGADPDADGYLHAYEIYELDLRAQLAVLTACETGVGKNDGEGVRSLGYGFAYAGCPSLVMSLWNIDEKVSSEIITRFYANLADGMPKHEALRKAKLDHLAHAPDELALPYYWAGMVLVGDVGPVATFSIFGSALWWIIGAVILALLGILLWRRKTRPVLKS